MSAGWKHIKIWDVVTGQCIKTLNNEETPTSSKLQNWHTDLIDSFIILPNSWLGVSGDSNNTIKIWNLATGKYLKTLHQGDEANRITALAVSSKGLLVSTDNYTLTIFDLNTGQLQRRLKLRNCEYWFSWKVILVVSPENWIACGGHSSGIIEIWNLATGEFIQTLKGHSEDNTISTLKILPNGWLISCAHITRAKYRDCTTKIWDVNTGTCLKTLEHKHSSSSLNLLSNGQLASSMEGNMYFWLNSPKTFKLEPLNTGSPRKVNDFPELAKLLILPIQVSSNSTKSKNNTASSLTSFFKFNNHSGLGKSNILSLDKQSGLNILQQYVVSLAEKNVDFQMQLDKKNSVIINPNINNNKLEIETLLSQLKFNLECLPESCGVKKIKIIAGALIIFFLTQKQATELFEFLKTIGITDGAENDSSSPLKRTMATW